jgi:amidohydrolase
MSNQPLSVTELRRMIHRYPELGFEETHTSRLVRVEVETLGLEIVDGFEGSTAVVALVRGPQPGRTVVLRADMDALNLTEESGVPFASERPGLMHACGHDAHTAILVGAARELVRRRQEIRGTVKLVFQPAEETGRGAAFLIDHGVLDRPAVDGAFALHIDPMLPAGSVSVREGPVFAAGAGFHLEILGNGGHPGLPHQTVDAIAVAAQVVQAAQILTSRQSDPQKPFTLGFGTIQGGTRSNVISDKVILTGTARALDSDVLAASLGRFEAIVAGTVSAFGAAYRLDLKTGGIPLVNEAGQVALVRRALVPVLGVEHVVEGQPILGGEDFAVFASKVPAAMVMLGGGFVDRPNFPLHHPRFQIDEAALPVGVTVLVESALAFLNAPTT